MASNTMTVREATSHAIHIIYMTKKKIKNKSKWTHIILKSCVFKIQCLGSHPSEHLLQSLTVPWVKFNTYKSKKLLTKAAETKILTVNY